MWRKEGNGFSGRKDFAVFRVKMNNVFRKRRSFLRRFCPRKSDLSFVKNDIPFESFMI